MGMVLFRWLLCFLLEQGQWEQGQWERGQYSQASPGLAGASPALLPINRELHFGVLKEESMWAEMPLSPPCVPS